jgi:hypothetical protein
VVVAWDRLHGKYKGGGGGNGIGVIEEEGGGGRETVVGGRVGLAAVIHPFSNKMTI